MKGIWIWLRGKKTYIVAASVAVATAVGVGIGKLTYAQALTLLGFAGASVGLGDKIERHSAEVIAALEDVTRIGSDVVHHDDAELVEDSVHLVSDATKLGAVIKADKG